jgi:hypothetical protein
VVRLRSTPLTSGGADFNGLTLRFLAPAKQLFQEFSNYLVDALVRVNAVMPESLEQIIGNPDCHLPVQFEMLIGWFRHCEILPLCWHAVNDLMHFGDPASDPGSDNCTAPLHGIAFVTVAAFVNDGRMPERKSDCGKGPEIVQGATATGCRFRCLSSQTY